ncbi:MAG: hypothetical protein QXJ12_01710 [Candidatus Parvarchaeota archaeon]|nr:hypothetical protein [Candidatus Parvarchaeota archaeon]
MDIYGMRENRPSKRPWVTVDQSEIERIISGYRRIKFTEHSRERSDDRGLPKSYITRLLLTKRPVIVERQVDHAQDGDKDRDINYKVSYDEPLIGHGLQIVLKFTYCPGRREITLQTEYRRWPGRNSY